jgi:single-strand DNA-binding protein
MLEVHVVGTIGKTPELKNAGQDNQYTVVGIATDKFVGEGKGDVRDGQATSRKTTWIDVVFFKATAKYVCDKFNQGDKLIARGELDIKRYEKKDKESGQVIDPNALSIRVLANDVDGPFRVVKNGNGEAASETPAQAPARAAAPARQAAPTRPAPAAAPKQAVAPKAGPAPVDDDIPFALILPFILPLTAAIAGGLSLLA